MEQNILYTRAQQLKDTKRVRKILNKYGLRCRFHIPRSRHIVKVYITEGAIDFSELFPKEPQEFSYFQGYGFFSFIPLGAFTKGLVHEDVGNIHILKEVLEALEIDKGKDGYTWGPSVGIGDAERGKPYRQYSAIESLKALDKANA